MGAPLPKAIWKAQAGSQTNFLQCPVTEIMYAGTRGPGKTDATLMKFAKYVGKGYGADWKGVIFAPKYKNLDEVVSKGKKWFYAAFGKDKVRFLASKDTYKFVWESGEELLLRVLENEDDYWNYHGHEYPFIAFEELTKWRDNTLYEMMRSVNRSSREGMPRFYLSTTNPYGVGHGWVKAYWIDPSPEKTTHGAVFRTKRMITVLRNGILVKEEQTILRCRFDGDLLENLILLDADPGYLSKLESIESEDLRMAWRFGSWEVNVGSFFDGILVPKRHKVAPFMPPITWRRWRALDWGSSKPYSVGWYAMNEDKEIFRYRELYGCTGKPDVGTRLPASEVASQIKAMEKIERQAGCKFTNNPADDSIFDNLGHEQSIAELFARSPNNINWAKARKNKVRRIQGWGIIIECLYHDQIKITSDCKHFWRTMPLQMVSDTDSEDIDTDGEDHIADEFRYSIVSRHMPKAKTEQSKAPKPGTYDHLLQLGI